MINDRDADALKHLRDVTLEYLKEGEGSEGETQGKPGFKIFFWFAPNEFFENEVLTKTYLYQEEVGYSGDFVYDRALGTTIKWKDEKDLTKEYEIKKQRNKSKFSSYFAITVNQLIFQIPIEPASSAKPVPLIPSSISSLLPSLLMRKQLKTETSTMKTSPISRKNSRSITRSAKISRKRSVDSFSFTLHFNSNRLLISTL